VTTYTRPLEELRRSDASEFGGKSASLGELLSAGLRVPPGFALRASAFAAFTEETGLAGTIAAALARVSPGNLDTIDAASKAIGESMRFASLPEAVRAELVARYREIGDGDPPVAVRSSALGEDSEEASHAGQQESFLWVRGADQVCDAVRDCWVSLYASHAISYRATLGADAATAMGVTVQLMVDADVSGVLFTCNPVSGDPSMVAVNASWGLGIAVVSGELTPDDYLVSKVTGEVVRQTVSDKGVEYVPDAAGRGTVRREVPAERRSEPSLGEAELAALVDVGRRIEAHYGSHQDVEWAIAREAELPESIVVLQSRPVTTLPERPPAGTASAIALVMSKFGAGEKPSS
jgi:phosphoenolpyruvate synthase/pyruvate phosphate dikinase